MPQTKPRKDTGAGRPRPKRWKKRSPRPLIDSIYLGEEGRREVETVARIYGVTLGEVVRTLVLPHLGALDRAFEEHREMMEG